MSDISLLSTKNSKMLKIGATSCQILRLKCNKFDFGWGFAIDTLGELTTFPQAP